MRDDWDQFDNDWEQFDENFYLRLMLYVEKHLMPKLIWLGERQGLPPRGISSEDLIQNAIEKTINGKRNWNKKKNDLFCHLCNVIRSDLNHLANSQENRTTIRIDQSHENVIVTTSFINPEDNLIRKQIEEDRAKTVSMFLDYCRIRDSQLVELYYIIENGEIKREIAQAEYMGLSVLQLQNLKKKMNRYIKEFTDTASKSQKSRKGGPSR